MMSNPHTINVQQAFITGWQHGFAERRDGKLTQAPREVHQRFPKWSGEQVDAYLNGEEDGYIGDSWRFKRIRAALGQSTLA